MKTLLRFANTPADRAAARALRDELVAGQGWSPVGRPGPASDPDLDGRTLCAFNGTKVVGSMDVHWGGDAELPADKLAFHKVGELAPDAPPHLIVLLDPALIHASLSQQPLEMELHEAAARFALRKQARWVFSHCHPVDAAVYGALGFKVAGSPGRSRARGEHVAILLDLHDLPGLRAARSPLVALAEQIARLPPPEPKPEAAVPAALSPTAAPAATGKAPVSRDEPPEKLDSKAVWRTIFELQRQARDTGAEFLSDIRESELSRLMLGSNVILPKRGQRIIKRGDRKRDLFLILAGQVEVRHEGRHVATLGAGDVVGEIGLLLDTRRTSDVLALGDDTCCLQITEQNLKEIMDKDPALAARISLGIAKALCLKLIRTSGIG